MRNVVLGTETVRRGCFVRAVPRGALWLVYTTFMCVVYKELKKILSIQYPELSCQCVRVLDDRGFEVGTRMATGWTNR